MRILDDQIDNYRVGLTHVLEALDRKEAFVTDLAQVSDFTFGLSEEYCATILGKLEFLLKRNISESEYIWEISKEVEEKVL